MRVLYPGRIASEIWRLRFLRREENQRTQKNTLGVRGEATTNFTHMLVLIYLNLRDLRRDQC